MIPALLFDISYISTHNLIQPVRNRPKEFNMLQFIAFCHKFRICIDLDDDHPFCRIHIDELTIYTDGHELTLISLWNPPLISIANCVVSILVGPGF